MYVEWLLTLCGMRSSSHVQTTIILKKKQQSHNSMPTWISMCVSLWAISSCLLPWWYERPLHPLSHVPDDKMVSVSATMWAGRSKITQAARKYGKGQQGQYLFKMLIVPIQREKERERGPMTWLRKYETCVTRCWHILAKDRLQAHAHTHAHKHTESFSPIDSQGMDLSSSSLLFRWRLQVALMNRKIVYRSFMIRHPFAVFAYVNSCEA